jgi:hypothetical protein
VAIDDPLQIIDGKITTMNSMESPDFDAKKFLAEVHANTSYDDLFEGYENLQRSLASEEQQIKQLVSNNFNKFIQSKDTIDAVVRQINKNEARSYGDDAVGAAMHKRAGAIDDDDSANLNVVCTCCLCFGCLRDACTDGRLSNNANLLYKPILTNVREMM